MEVFQLGSSISHNRVRLFPPRNKIEDVPGNRWSYLKLVARGIYTWNGYNSYITPFARVGRIVRSPHYAKSVRPPTEMTVSDGWYDRGAANLDANPDSNPYPWRTSTVGQGKCKASPRRRVCTKKRF